MPTDKSRVNSIDKLRRSLVEDDVANPLQDALSGSAQGEGRLRVEIGALQNSDLMHTLAVWHCLLNWLRYDHQMVVSCVLIGGRSTMLPLVSIADNDKTFAGLKHDIEAQFENNESWVSVSNLPEHIQFQRRSHAVLVNLDSSDEEFNRSEFNLACIDDAWFFDVNRSNFSEAYITGIAAFFRDIVNVTSGNPDIRVSELVFPFSSSAPLGYATGTNIPIESNLVNRFNERFQNYKSSIAVVDEYKSYSYQELDDISNQVAAFLKESGASAGDCIALAFPRTAAMVISQYAVLKLGAVFVPLDYSLPRERIASMHQDASFKCILVDDSIEKIIKDKTTDIPIVSYAKSVKSKKHKFKGSPKITPSDPAYVIFTSGSTGMPKGVKVTHGNLLNFVAHFEEENYVGNMRVSTQFAPFSFDASVAEIHTSILNGKTLLLLSKQLIDSPVELQQYLTKNECSFAVFPPQYLQHLSPESLPTLERLVTAGSAPNHEILEKWMPHVEYMNAYGPTETTALSTAWEADEIPEEHQAISMGKPIANTDVLVVNQYGQSLPVGMIGELVIGGAGVALGYLNREALNREKFYSDNGVRRYKSGDLASFNADMQLFFKGRVDDQIKLRGHRLEPGEIETAVHTLDYVDLAAVVVHKSAQGLQLVLFLQGDEKPESVVRKDVADKVPDWAMPNRIVWKTAFPLTTNGKIDYKRLKNEAEQDDSIEIEAVEYTNALEKDVAKIWANVLQRRVIQRDDNFLFLGGDSLTALVVVSSLRNHGYNLSSSLLISHPVFSDFVSTLERQGKSLERNYDPETGSAPLTPIQAWFFNQRLSNPKAFCQSLVFDTHENLDVETLHQALEKLVQYHDSLRVFFENAKGQWRQIVRDDIAQLMSVKEIIVADGNLDKVSENQQLALTEDLDIENGPLFRVAVLQTQGSSRVVFVLHHLIVDTISHAILLNDLQALYQNSEAAVEAVLPGKSLGYLAWSRACMDALSSDIDGKLAFWQPTISLAKAAPSLPLSASSSTTLSVENCIFDEGITEKLLESAPACYNQAPEELLMAAVFLATAQAFELATVGLAVEWHGRDEYFAGEKGLDRTVGWFTSIHPLYLNVPQNQSQSTLRQFLCELKEQRAAIPNRGRDFYGLQFQCEQKFVREAFEGYTGPEIMFNFSGVVQRSSNEWQTVAVSAIEMGEGNENPYRMSVESQICDGKLIVGLYIDHGIWSVKQLNAFKQALNAQLFSILDHCCNPENARWTPSDFPRLELRQEECDQLPANLENAFLLTDMQQTLYRHKEIYQVWMHYELPLPFEETAFEGAMADWVSQNECLRTLIHTWSDGKVAQLVLAEMQSQWSAKRVDSTQLQQTVEREINAQRHLPVEFSQQAPYSVTVFHSGSGAFSVLLSIHHIIHDGWTIELLLDSLSRFYANRLGRAVRLPTKSLASMQQILDEQFNISQSSDWNNYWGSVAWSENYCTLPEKSAAEGKQASQVELLLTHLPNDLVKDARLKAQELGITLNSLFLSGFVCLLRYIGGGHQVRCGVIQSGRPEAILEVDKITGCCVNTLPLVVDFTAEDLVTDILSQVQQQLLKLRDSAAYPLSKIYTAAKSKVSGELFECLFNIESSDYGATVSDIKPVLKGGYESTNYGFIFGIIEQLNPDNEKSYGLRLGYDTARYSEAMVQQWVSIYENILKILVTQAHSTWGSVNPLPASAMQNVADWNNTTADYPSQVLLGEHFIQAVKRNPEKNALAFKDITISYRELDEQTDRLARLLASKGVGPEVVVGLVAERSLEMVYGILAIIRAGGAYVPIDPKYPEDRVTHMLEELGCSLILLQKAEFSSTIPASLKTEQITIADGLETDVSALPVIDATSHDTRQLAYVMYTSGSTGKPKGVMIEQRSIVRLIKNSQDIQFAQDDCILITSAPGFDVTTYELWSALLNGLTLAVIDEDTLLDPLALAREIREKQVTFLWVVAPLFNQLVQEKPDLFAPVKRIMIGGDALSPFHINLAREHSPQLEFINGYGPTENTSFSTYHFLSEADSEIIPIGRPITNSTCYVLNPDGHLLPAGVKGELCVGGHGVARGYFKRKDLTAERFFANPFVSQEDILYRTGDLVSWRDNGLIDFHGRIDFQIKIRGFRVELGEIETVILRVAAVKQAIVLAKDFGNQKRLVAYVVQDKAVNNQAQDEFVATLKADLAAELTDYMVPENIVVLEAMPLNANGKIDRGRLPEPDYSLESTSHEAPSTDTEQVLWNIWKEILNSDSFGVTDNFYMIGGDSIVAIQVVSRALKHGIKLSPRILFEHKTIRELAKYTEAGVSDSSSKNETIEQEVVSGEQRLLPIHLQFLYTDTTDVHHYNQAAKVLLPGNLSREALQQVLISLVQRHDALRLRFRQSPTGWVGRYNSAPLEKVESVFDWMTELDLRLVNENEQTSILEHALAEMQASLDLKKGILCRWLWVRNSEGDCLYWSMHHLIVDGISWRILLTDFESALQQVLAQENIHLGAKTSSYQSWASHLYETAHSDRTQSEKDWWLQQLTAPSAALPFDQDSSENLEETSTVLEISLAEQHTEQLLFRANQVYQTHINDLLLSALMMALNEWAEITTIRVDLEGHGREELFDDVDISQTLGWFTTIYPVNLSWTRGDLGQQILALKSQLQEIPNKGIGFGLLHHIAQDEDLLDAIDDAQSSPIVFNYLGQMDVHSSTEVAGLAFEMSTAGGTVSAKRKRTHCLGFNGYVKNGVLTFKLDYSRNQFDADSVQKLGECFKQSLQTIIEHCTGNDDDPTPGFDLSTVSREQLQTLQSEYPGLKDIYPITAMQQGLVLFTQRDTSGAYLTQLRMELEALDVERFKRTWEILLTRYDILRTAFVDLSQQQLTQVVSESVVLPWQHVEFSGSSEELAALLHENRIQPFDTTIAPLMRLLLVSRENGDSVFAWTHHHALLDGWSMSVLIQDMLHTYEELASGAVQEKSVPAYKDYIRWLQAQDQKAAELFWKKQLSGIDAADALPQANSKISDVREQRVCTQVLSVDLSQQLQTLSRESGITLSAFVQNAWALLLSKYTSEQDVVFGYAISGRPPQLEGVEAMVGLFINSLPMRLQLLGEDSLLTSLEKIQQQQVLQDEHHFVALADIQKWLGVRADLRLFESLVVLENYPLDATSLNSGKPGALQVRDIQGVEQNDFALNLVIYPGDAVTVKLVYQSAIYSDDVANNMLLHFCKLLSGSVVETVADLQRTRLCDLPLLTAEQQNQAVYDWNKTEVDLPEGQSIYQLVQKKLLQNGSRTALVMDELRWSGDELDARVDVYARWLQNHGIDYGDLVAISLPKSPELLACILGVLKLGAAYVPVAVDCPKDRLQFISTDAAIKALVAGSADNSRFSDYSFPVLYCDSVEEAPLALNERLPVSVVPDPSEHLAYVIYTSGTTGQPKGVAITHTNLINFSYWCLNEQVILPGQNASQFAPFTFDASVGESFGALISGAELHLLSDALIENPDAVTQYLADNDIAFGAFPPPYLQQMAVEKLPTSLKILTAGSAPAIEKVREWGEHCTYINAYGPTETTVLSSAWWYEPSAVERGKLPIGRPIINTQMYVVDQYGQLCPPGITGEIYIGGAGVAKGYLNRDDLSQKHFIDDAWRSGNRVYRTGDLGHWLEDGTIEFAGRRDHQVKIRGFRIELSGIEYQLRQQPEVDQVSVLAKTIGSDNQLLAWIVPTESAGKGDPVELVAKLRAALREKLAHYMVPQGFMVVEDLPLTANGKIDTKALLAQDIDPIYEGGYVAPEGELQTTLTDIWAELLHLDPQKLSVTANFFDIGGHSLLATRVATEIALRLGVKIEIRDIFEKGNIAALASLIEAGGTREVEIIPVVDRTGTLPPSFSQQRLWFIDMLEKGSAQYNQPLFLRVEGQLNLNILQRVLNTIIDRHEVLRTCFVSDEGEPRLHIQAPRSVEIAVSDIRHLSGEACDAELKRLLESEVSQVFNLQSDLMLKASLIKTTENNSVLAMTLHHIASDGWSFTVLIDEITTLYTAYSDEIDAPLPVLPLQYTDYAAWQHTRLRGDYLQSLTEYWQNQLEDLPQVHKLPLDYPRPHEQSYRGDIFVQTIGAELTHGMRALAKQHKSTLFMVLHACFSAVLARYSHDDDIVVGTPIANREQPGLESLIGFFVNTLVLRNKVSLDMSFTQLLQHSREVALQAYAHQQMPFDLLVEELQPERSLSYNPLFQVMLSLENIDSRRALQLPGAELSALENPFQVMAQFDLSVDIEENESTLVAQWSFATDLFKRDTIERMASHLERFIEQALKNPGNPIHAIEMMSPPEIDQLLGEFNQPLIPELISETWPELFVKQAAANPDKVVASCGDKTLTFAELAKQSQDLAHALLSRGVTQGSVVGLLDHRGIDLLVMIVGVLRAGAAYLPLDPTQPSNRWLEILEDSQPHMLLVGDSLTDEATLLSDQWDATKILQLAEALAGDFDGALALPEVRLDDLAYVIFTSGSTGKPKGVMIEHRGMINNMLSKVEPLGLSQNDVIAQTASQCFDISVWQFLTAPILGAQVVIFSNETTRDPQALVEFLGEHGVTIWEPVSSVIQAILPLKFDLAALRWVLPTGEALVSALVTRWFAQYPAIPLMNAYGPAECSDDVSFEPIHGPVERVLIGKPVANARLHVVDDYLNLLPVGVVGELAVSGPVVGRGYLHRPSLTEKVFKTNPFPQDEMDTRLYLSGDLAKRHADGSLEFVGRKDNQVKVRGFRIELGEIEARLVQQATVKEAVVRVVEVDEQDKRLIAYVVIQPNMVVSIEELREAIRAELPEYMVPTWLVTLDKIPLTPNGKVDNKALPQPDTSNLNVAEYFAPQGEVETLLAEIWQKVLCVERVGRRDNFFNLGGHSLLVMKLIEELRLEGMDMDVRSIFEAQDLASLATMIRGEGEMEQFHAPENLIPENCQRVTPQLLPLVNLSQELIDNIAQQVPGGHSNIQDIYPLTPLQEGILFDHLVSDVGDTYLASVLLGFDTREVLDRYLSALQQLVNRHDSLRTAVIWEDMPQSVQVVYRHAELQITNVLLDAKRDAIEQFEEKMSLEGRHIDLRKAPVLGLMIAQDPTSGIWLVLQQQHHLMCDQVSMEIEFQDILAYMNDCGDTLAAPVPYREFVAHTMHRSKTFDAQAYFREKLAGVDEPTAPFGLMDVYRGDKQTEEVVQALDVESTRRVREISHKLAVSPAAIFHLAWGLVLARCCNRDDVVFGTVTSGRLQGTSGSDRTFGLFINMLPMRLSLAGKSVAEAMKLTRDTLVELLNYEQAPLVEAQRCSDLPGSTPLFSAVLNYRHEGDQKLDLQDLIEGVKILRSPGDISNYLFDMSVSDEGENFTLTASIDRDIGGQRIMDYMCRALNQVARALDDEPDTYLLSLPVLSDKEQIQLLSEFNAPFQRHLFSKTWTALFAEQAAKSAQKTVAICGEQTLTFAELNRLTDDIARALQHKGLGRGSIVGLLDDRSIDLLVMIVGVLKAGAAYLPLDPTQPTKRWLEILKDSKPDLLMIGNRFAMESRWLKRKWLKDKIITLDEARSVAFDSNSALPEVSLNDLAYVIFTSGSTGKPKGVMIEHLGMINNMLSKVEPLGLSEKDVIAQTASQCFDISVWQFLTAPILGATVVIVTNDTTRDPQALVECLQKNSVSIWEPVPSVMQALLPLAHPLPDLRWVLPTGEALVSGLVDRWFKQYPSVPLMNAYGPAECSDDVSFQPIHGPVERVFIGKPVANARLHVVDNHLALLPVGVVGELAISGPVVGRGYLHRPELTDEVFKANPYAQDELDTRLYLTGDLVKRHEDGNLEYMGRKDFQVKVRGFRIELGEIESRLSQHPVVKEAVVMALPNAQGEKYLVAYLTYNASPLSKEQLVAHLAAELPDYMVPGVYMALETMPLNNNGKIDRKQLPEPDLSATQQEYEAPQTDVEIVMAKAWQDILQIDQVGRNDNFFDLGGNSIQIIRMLSELKAQGVELRANDIYQHRVLKECSSCVKTVEQNLAAWLQAQDSAWEFVEFNWHRETKLALVLSASLKNKSDELSKSLAYEEESQIPDYIVFDDDPESIARRIKSRGLHALSAWQSVDSGKVKRSLQQQMESFEHDIVNGVVEQRFPFSPMQKELLQWHTRDDFEWVSIRGYYAENQLREAFYQLMCEQDMLRSLLDEQKQEWVLIDKASLKSNFPYLDLSGMQEAQCIKLMKQLFKRIRDKQYASQLPFMGVWIKRSDTLHQLMIMDDHFISDGVSSVFIQQRLEDIVKDRAACIHNRYRDYIHQVWSHCSEEDYQSVSQHLALQQTAGCVATTVNALKSRKQHKLRSHLIKLPLQQGVAPVDQAFNCFKQWVTELLGLQQFVMVMNHYGRQLGDSNYFDQIGLFLDKIPLLVSPETGLQQLGDKTEYLVKNSISYMALEKQGFELCQKAFPGLIHEILFNYEGELGENDVMHEVLAETQTEDKLKQYCGILFEAYSLDNDLVIHCAFRGNKEDDRRLMKIIPGEVLNPSEVLKSRKDSNPKSTGRNVGIKRSNNGVRNMSYSIEINDVKKHYGSFEAVKGVSFKVEQGVCFGILGPNGAGKTSLLGMIEGISPITSGSISVLGLDVATQIKKIQPHIGVQLQQNNYFEFLTVIQLLNFYKELRSANKRKVSGASVDELLEQLNLTDKKSFKVDELSGGQKQRLSIAIALLEDPDILFLDEPTSALDPHSRHEVWEFVEYLKKDKSKTIILTTHYMEEAETLCDQLMIMSEGRIVSQGTPAQLINTLSPHHDIHLQFGRGQFETDYLVELSNIIDYQWESQAKQLTIKTAKFTETLKDILSISESKSLEILNFNINRPNLEDVFLSSTKKELVE
ncbi:non-ribosomal peptide synthase protein (TIGR01720 family)/amino acid adenylation domain-containing protein [Alteromonadaceae bacterium 2753L.S.0a.02]|nr:non-ribosomal peptide synthase protein (TIGR01720 family)/amino acid adenylation domain-containing protein [Alteromonadaceae bacterium 2753L.S.0a.02]